MERVRNPRGKHISVGSLLLDLRVSRRTLERSFQRELGMGPSEAIRRHRIRLAKTMLADQDLPIKDIALRTGFANPSQFSVAFHAATGMTPGEYRLNLCA
jgi:transcriptional regulator GlxA family with amidase domain